jgi:hypothetical protein
LRQRRLSDVIDGQTLTKNTQGTAAAGSAEGVYLWRELAGEISDLHVDKREEILRGGVINQCEKLEAAWVEVRNGRDFAANVNLGNNFLFCVIAYGAEVVPAATVNK